MGQLFSQPGQPQSQIWPAQQPYLKQVMGAAQGLYNSGTGYGASPQYSNALAALNKAGKAGNPLWQPSKTALTGLMGNGGITSQGVYNGLLGQGGGVGTGTFAGLAANGGVDSGAWSGLASNGGISTQGGYNGLLGQNGGINTMGQDQGLLGQVGNDAFSSALDTQAGKLTDDINREFSGLGRTGSAAQSGTIADQVGAARNQALANEWQQNVANQRGIIGDISQSQNQNMVNQLAGEAGLTQAQNANQQNMIAGQQGMTNAQNMNQQNLLAGAAGLASAQNMNMVNQLSGAQGLTNAQNAAAGNMLGAVSQAPSAYAAKLAPIQARLQAGQGLNAMQNAPWNRLGAYSSLVGGPVLNSQQQLGAPQASPLGLGLGLAAGGLGGMFGI